MRYTINIAVLSALAFSANAEEAEMFSGDAVSAGELQQSRGKQNLFSGVGNSTAQEALLSAGTDDETLKGLFAAFAASGGLGAEIYNVSPSATTGNTLQSDGLSSAGSAAPSNYNLQHSFPSGMTNPSGMLGIVGSVRPE